MGLHDGVDGTAFGSTAHVARLLEAPVLLAVDAKGASRTVHAVVRGVAGYDPAVRVAGVVFNRLGSARHRELIETGSASCPSSAGFRATTRSRYRAVTSGSRSRTSSRRTTRSGTWSARTSTSTR